MDTMDIQTDIIKTEIKWKLLSTKKWVRYGSTFQVLDEKQLEDMFKLAEDIKMPVYKNNENVI